MYYVRKALKPEKEQFEKALAWARERKAI